MRTGFGMIAFLLALGAWTSAGAEKDRLEVGEEVKDFTLKVVNTDEVPDALVGVNRYYGAEAKEPKKAILLSFFATYCEPCKREMPYLAALYDTYRDKGLQVLLISIDTEAEKVDVARELAKKAGVKFPVLSDRFNIVAKRFFISKLPCVYLVNSEGKVAMVNVGYSDDISKLLLENIRKAVGEPTSDPIPPRLTAFFAGEPAAAAAVEPAADAADPAAAPDAEKAKGKGAKKGKGKSKAKKGK